MIHIDTVISMPEHNEGEVLLDFIGNLESELNGISFIIVDDLSPREFKDLIQEKYNHKKTFHLLFNEINSGHGISTVKGLKKALELNFDYVVAIDGDGQFKPQEVKKCIEFLKTNSNIDLVEGVRILRNEPWFRKIISFFTRFLIFSKTFKWPKDANTPLRVYRRHILQNLLGFLPDNSLIPNLHISKLTRKLDLNFKEIEVTSLPRGGKKENIIQSVSWKQKFRLLPSKRLIIFCLKATKEWLTS